MRLATEGAVSCARVDGAQAQPWASLFQQCCDFTSAAPSAPLGFAHLRSVFPAVLGNICRIASRWV